MMEPPLNMSEARYKLESDKSIIRHDTDDKITIIDINNDEVKTLYPLIIFYTAVMIIGVIGNALVLIVYTFRYKRSPARVYILFLAGIDFTICLFGLPYHLIDLTHPYTFTSSITCKILTFVITTLFHMSVFGLIVIAIDRYLKICRPLGRMQVAYFGKCRACGAAVLASVLLSWPNLILYGPSEMESHVGNITGYACFFETKYLETNYPIVYIMSTLCVCIGSTVFLIVAYSLIYLQIYKRYRGSFFCKPKCKRSLFEDTTMTDELVLKTITAQTSKNNSSSTSKCPSIATSLQYINLQSGLDQQSADSTQNGKLNTRAKSVSNMYQDVLKSLSSTQPMQAKFSSEHVSKCDDEEKRHSRNSDIVKEILVETSENEVSDTLDDTKRDYSQLEKTNTTDDESREKCDKLDTEYGTNIYDYITDKQSSDQLDSNRKTDNTPNSDHNHIYSNGNIDTNKVSGDLEISNKELNKFETHTQDFDKASNYISNSSLNSIKTSLQLNVQLKENKLNIPNGFAMCRPATLKRRSSEQISNHNAAPQKSRRSASLAVSATNSAVSSASNSITQLNIDIYNNEEGLRVHSSSCNSVLIPSIGNKQPQKMSTKHSKITKIMLTITIVFILSYSPALIVTIWSIVQPELWDLLSIHETIWCEFFLRFYIINNVCNPFIYGFWDRRFKHEVANSFRKIARLIRDKCFCSV